ncbi:MAG TPA: TatD family hydrolase [Vicinamibacterales bacterium]|nr:TatD family hydrolase [Vicinamibacterales bacterium]
MIDTHCHLAGEEFEADLPEVIARAKQAGVDAAVVILAAQDDVELTRWQRVRQLWPEARAAVGVHPHQAGAFATDPEAAARLLGERLDSVPDVRAVGEIGLDYHYDFSPREVQQAVFRAQLQVARDRRLPVVIHTREAEADTLGILGEGGRVETTGVFHCFSGDAAAAARALATGYYLSIPGIVSFPRASELREAVRTVPRDRLLVETDSPYLAPTPLRGKRNEPAHVVRVGNVIAESLGISSAELDALVSANARRLFRL